jgi:hypothetical protein
MRLHAVMGLALLAGAVTGCQAHRGGSAAQSAEDQAADDEVAGELRDHHRHHNRGGVTQFIVMSLDTLGTDESRRAQVDQVQADLLACMAPTREIESKLLLGVADGVAAGAVDKGKVDQWLAQLSAAAAVMRECRPDALNQLHGILSTAERGELADKVEAHFDVWREVNTDAEAREKKGPRRGMEELTRELTLTPEQLTSVSAALDAAHGDDAKTFDPKVASEYVKAFAEEFPKESFDARAIAPDMNGRLVGHGVRRMAAFYEIVTPLLTPEQRNTLAAHLREHANHQPAVSAK